MFIVIISHDYPPGTVAGAMRPAWLARGLAARGHKVMVITAQESPSVDGGELEVISLPYARTGALLKRAAGVSGHANVAAAAATHGRAAEAGVRFIARNIERLIMHPDKQRAWISVCKRWMRDNAACLSGADVIIATSPPVSAAFVGKRAAKATGAPLIVDFRDLWTDNLYYPYGPLRRTLDRAAEKLLLRATSGITVVTESLAKKVSNRSDLPLAVVQTVPSRPAILRPAPPFAPGAVFRIGFFGTTYGGRRDLRPILEAIKGLDAKYEKSSDVRLEAWGDIDTRTVEFSEKDPQLALLANFPGLQPKDAVNEMLLNVHLALCPMWPEDVESLPLKIFEYLAAGREILITGAREDSEVRATFGNVAGVHFAGTEREIEEVLLDAYRRWKTGDQMYRPNRTDFPWMSYEAFVDGFLEIISTVRDSKNTKSTSDVADCR